LPSTEKTIDQYASADIGRGIDDCVQTGQNGQLTGMMMIEVINDHTLLQQGIERYTIASQRDIQHRNPVASMGLNALKEGNLAFSACDQRCLRRMLKP
jgi:hypothetical protein